MDWKIAIPGVAGAIFGSVLTAMSKYWPNRADRDNSVSNTQNSLNDSFKIFMHEANDKMMRLEAEADNCHFNHAECEGRTEKLEGNVRELTQYNVSLASLLRRHGIPIPKKDFQSIAVMYSSKPLEDI